MIHLTEQIKQDIHEMVQETNKYISENQSELERYKSVLETAKDEQERSLCRSMIYHLELMIKNLEEFVETCEGGLKNDSAEELDRAMVLASLLSKISDAHYGMICSIRESIIHLK